METRSENPTPYMAVPVGDIISAELEERNMSQKELAKIIGMQPSHLSELIRGRYRLSSEIAIKIGDALGMSGRTLLNAQANYDYDSKVISNRTASKKEAAMRHMKNGNMPQSIRIDEGKESLSVSVSVTVYLFDDKGEVISYCPALDLTGHGENSVRAKLSMRIIVEEYLRTMLEDGSLDRDLMSKGWKKKGKRIEEPDFSSLYTSSNRLKQIMDIPNLSKYQEVVRA